MNKISICSRIKTKFICRSREQHLAKQSMLIDKVATDISKTAQLMVQENNNKKVVAEAMELGKLASQLLGQSEALQQLIKKSGK